MLFHSRRYLSGHSELRHYQDLHGTVEGPQCHIGGIVYLVYHQLYFQINGDFDWLYAWVLALTKLIKIPHIIIVDEEIFYWAEVEKRR